MYYIIENIYIGPNPNEEKYLNANSILISKSPAITNSSREVRLEGWCGADNDWSTVAHGKYETLQDARDAISERFGSVRATNSFSDKLLIDQEYLSYDYDIVEIYKIGRYERMDLDGISNIVECCVGQTLFADTSDEQIVEIAAECEAELNTLCSLTLGEYFEDYLRDARDRLRKEQQELLEDVTE